MNNLEEKLKAFADEIRSHATEVLCDFESDILPYVEDDTFSNARIQTEEIVRAIIEGSFEWEGDYIKVRNVREFAPSVRIEFSQNKWDRLRDSIIERMPKCPKDAKIKALEEQLETACEVRRML